MDADFDDLPPDSLSRAVAIADFEEASPDQLSFSEGDQLEASDNTASGAVGGAEGVGGGQGGTRAAGGGAAVKRATSL